MNKQNNKWPVDFRQPPPRKTDCPIIDAHTHINASPETDKLVEAARLYGIDRIVGIASIDTKQVLDKRHTGQFNYAVTLDYRNKDNKAKFQNDNMALLEKAAELDFKIIKFWFKPPFNVDQKMKLDDERLAPIFDRMGELNLTGLVHIADPDVWFERVYADVNLYGSKADQFKQLENMLAQHPGTNMIGAHMGGDPENLEHLRQMLGDHPNFYIDTSATKWVTREVSLKPKESREFIIKHADRILYGSDLVVRRNWPVELYMSRYWIHRVLWESDTVCDLPIEDPDHPGNPQIVGIDLPVDVLEKLYYHNAVRLLGIKL